MTEFQKVDREYTKDSPISDFVDRHPAFAQARLSRVHHGGTGQFRLYASPLRWHPATIMLTIVESERCHDLSRDRHCGTLRPMIEVEFSAAQFADLITNMNVGSGACCTLTAFDGKTVPSIPIDDDTEIDRIEAGFKEELHTKVMEIAGIRDDVHRVLEKRSLNKGDRTVVKSFVDRVYNFFTSSAPFVVEQFSTATEKVKTEAKKDIDAFVHMVVENTGLKVLEKMSDDAKGKLLTKGIIDIDDDELDDE